MAQTPARIPAPQLSDSPPSTPAAATVEPITGLRPAVYPYLLDPTIYADYTRRPTRAPTWDTFDNTPQFVCMRQLPDATYTNQNLGRVCWPDLGRMLAPNLPQSLDEIKRRGYYLFDIWGYVPGSAVYSFHAAPETLNLIDGKLGDHFLGFDLGEQDARYMYLMRQIQTPYAADRIGQYINADHYMSRISDDLGNRINALVQFWYWPYVFKDGRVVLAGEEAENKCGGSSNLHYAFLRGAGKQYGIHWFGNASMFNTWDYKSYHPAKGPLARITGPTRGNSLSLLRRLLFSDYLYNSVILSFEGALFTDDWWSARGSGPLSPLGLIQQDAVKFVDAHRQPGVMHAPVALLLDYYAGWMPARTWTTAYQVWGYTPYDWGDYLTHNVFQMFYPGYEDCGWYHDERGTVCNTPYGDMVDVMHSDAAAGVFQQYNVIVAAGNLFTADAELRDKLDAFTAAGGCLVVTAENARRLFPLWRITAPRRLPAGTIVQWNDGSQSNEPLAFDLCGASLPKQAQILARCGALPAVARIRHGSGSVVLLLCPSGINAESAAQGDLANHNWDQPLPQPYVLPAHVKKELDSIFRSQRLFSVGDGLGYITCRKASGDYTIGIFNNSLHARPFHIISYCGPVKTITELHVGRDMHAAAGYWPHDLQNNDGGKSDATNIAGGDVRLFSVLVNENPLRVLAKIKPSPRPKDCYLTLRGIADLRQEILRRPTFFEHFDGVKIDWTYLAQRDSDQVKRDRQWLDLQKLRVLVDFTPGLNHFPDLTLLDLSPDRYADSVARIDNVMDKMKIAGITEAIISTHQPPEIGATPQQIAQSFMHGLTALCQSARVRGITLCLQNRPDCWRSTLPETLRLIDDLQQENLHFALNTFGLDPRDAIARAGSRLAFVLASAPGKTIPAAQGPLSDGTTDLIPLKKLHVPLVLDADYPTPNDLFRDLKALSPNPDPTQPPASE